MNVQVWDGTTFTYMSLADAKKLVAAGTHEISSGKDANKLKRTFTPRKKRKSKTTGAAYKTREMRADNEASTNTSEQVSE